MIDARQEETWTWLEGKAPEENKASPENEVWQKKKCFFLYDVNDRALNSTLEQEIKNKIFL